jgi:hypothetical protein
MALCEATKGDSEHQNEDESDDDSQQSEDPFSPASIMIGLGSGPTRLEVANGHIEQG